MKRTLALLICGLLTASIVGCEASAKVGDTDDTTADHKTEYKKTTYRNDGGDRTVKTETRTERSY
jgi:hypothetical protein